MNLRFFPRLFYAIICWYFENRDIKRGPGDAGPRKLRDARSVCKSPRRRWSVTGRDKPRNARLPRAGSYQNAGSLARQGTIAAKGKRAGTLLENLTALGASANRPTAGGP